MFAAAIGGIISGVASMAGAAAQANAMNAQADAEERASRWNAERQREKAAYKQGEGAQQSAKTGREFDRKLSSARAAMAQGGLALDEGSPLLIQQEFAADKMFEQNKVMFNARVDENDLRNKANITEWEGKVRADASRAQAQASLLSGMAGMVKGIGGAFSGGGGGGGFSFGFG